MKVLLDSGVWWWRALEVPLKKPLADFLANDVTEWWLSPFSLLEMLYKVTHKKLPAPQKSDWLTVATRGYRIAPFTLEAGRQAGEWKWSHGDPIDRCLAATALTQGLTLIHTDKVLRDLPGFPNLYFPA
jgi:PIN domain nuclease of toxin-antitoxin system